MNAHLKKGLKITGITIGAIVVLLLILPFAFKGKILEVVKTEANKMLDAKLEFGDLDLSFFSHFPKATVELENFSLVGKGEFEGDTLVSAKEIDIAVNIMSLFGNKGYEINHIILDNPAIKAIVLEDGKANWDIMKSDTAQVAETDTASTSSSFALQLKKLRIKSGRLAYIDRAGKMQFYTDALDLQLKGDMSEKMTDIDCRMLTHNMKFMMAGVPYLKDAELEVNMKVNADFENNKYTFDKNTIRLNAIEMNIDGWLAMLGDNIDMDIKLGAPKIAFKDILSLIPGIYQHNFDALKASGNIGFNAWAKGIMAGDTLPAFDLGLTVDNGVVSYEGMPKSVDNIKIKTEVKNPGGIADKTTVNVENLSFSMAGNPFKLTLFASTPVSDLNFKATADGTINLGHVKDIYPLGDSVSLSGVVTAKLDFSGRMSDIEKERYENIKGEGTVAITGMDLTMKDMPQVSVTKAVATVSPKVMSLDELDVKVGKNDVRAKGSLSNYIPYFLKNETLKGSLTLNSDYLNLNDFMTSSSSGSESMAVTDTSALGVIEVPVNLDLSMKANMKQVLFDKIDIRNISGNLIVKDGAVRMSPLNFDAFGGKVAANGSYSTAKNKKRPEVNFDLNITKASFEETFKQLDMIRQIVPVFAKTGGSYSVKFDLKTPLDETMSPVLNELWANGVLSANDIHIQNLETFDKLATLLKNDKLRNIEAKDIEIPFTIENGLVKTKPFDIKMGNISMNLSGTTGLDQSIDYTAKISLPENTANGYLSNITAKIGGTFTKPSISLDTKSLVSSAVEKAIGDKLTSITGKDNTERIAELRRKADEAAKKIVETAQTESQKLVDKASKPLEKIAAKAAAKKLVEEAQKQADKLRAEAEEQIKKLEKTE